MNTCPACGSRLVEVDNPFRREVRHPRGIECDGIAPELTPELAKLLKHCKPISSPTVIPDVPLATPVDHARPQHNWPTGDTP